MGQTTSQPSLRHHYVIRILFRYEKEGTEMRKRSYVNYIKEINFFVINRHGTVQTSNEQCFEGNNRTQKAA
jgi:hypothetical protein